MIVPYGLPMGLLKCNKWRLAKNFGSLEWFVCGFQFDPSLHAAMVWPKKRGFWGVCLDNWWNRLRLFPENCVCFWKNHVKMFFFILPSFLFFDQGRRSCPKASCKTILSVPEQRATFWNRQVIMVCLCWLMIFFAFRCCKFQWTYPLCISKGWATG